MSDVLAVDATLALRGFRLDAHFRAPARGVTALFGPSGAGKSLLLSVIAGLNRIDAGRIEHGGRILDDSAAKLHVATHQRGVGLVFQDARLFPHMDVAANLAFAAARAPRDVRKPSIESLIEYFDIASLVRRNVHRLSGGERARVALARALASAPDLLLLDEPFAAVDAARKASFISRLRGVHESFAVPMLLVTHQIDDAVALAEHIVGIEAGRVVADGSLQDTTQRRSLRKLLAPRDVGAALAADALSSASTTPARSQWVRADHVLLALEAPAAISARNIWHGSVSALETEIDGSVLVHVATALGPILARITSEASSDLRLTPGQGIWAIVKAHSL